MSRTARAAQSTSVGSGSGHQPFGLIGRSGWPPTERSTLAAREKGLAVTWSEGDLTVEEVTIQPVPVTILPAKSAPEHVHAFVERVVRVKKVCRVIAETGEDGSSVHITTFVRELDEAARNELYAIEAETIVQNHDVVFDFHVRREEEVSGAPTPIAGEYFYYAIWGELNANSGRSSEASGR